MRALESFFGLLPLADVVEAIDRSHNFSTLAF